MSINSLEAAENALFEAFTAHDIDGMMAHYESGGVFVEQGGEPVKGVDAIRQSLTTLFQTKPRLTKRGEGRIIESGDLAVRLGSWTLQGTAPDGSSIEMHGAGFDVARRQPDGSWKMVIDNPWGTAILD